MADRRRKGLLCSSNGFVVDHKFSHADEGDECISLHAVSSVPAWDMMRMRLRVRVQGHDMVALVDSGSSRVFLQEGLAARLGLHPQPVPGGGMQVAVANGDLVDCSGVCRGTAVVVAGEPFIKFKVDCYMLPLGGDDLILGVEWLRTLGPILWDFTDLTMSCTVHGLSVTWRGERRPPASHHFLPKQPPPGGRDSSSAPLTSVAVCCLLALAVSIIVNIILLCRLL